MRPTPKWNEELPLPRGPVPQTPRRYEIVIDDAPPLRVMVRNDMPRPIVFPKKDVHMYEIQGTSLREDELIMSASNETNNGLFVDSRGSIHRLGENIPDFPSGRITSRSPFWTNPAKQPPNAVNAFPSGRLRKRAQPFSKRLTLQAIALSNPAAYHGLAIHPEAHIRGVFVGWDGSAYIQNDMGRLKKAGRFIKKTAKGAGKGIKKGTQAAVRTTKDVARPVARPVVRAAKAVQRKAVAPVYRKAIRPVGKGIAKTARPVGKFVKKNAAGVALTAALGPAGLAGYVAYKNRDKIAAAAKAVGKLSGKALVGVARAISSVAATPIRIAFAQFLGRKKASSIARANGRRTPNSQDKKEAVQWGYAQMKQKMGPLGTLTMHILKFTRGVPLAGVGGQRVLSDFNGWNVGAFDPGTITAYAGAIVAALAALEKTLSFATKAKKGDAPGALQTAADATQDFDTAQTKYTEASTPPPGQFSEPMSYSDYGTYEDAGTADDYATPSFSTEAPDSVSDPTEQQYASESYDDQYASDPNTDSYSQSEYDYSTSMGGLKLPSLISFG